jgi:hypothetical protein
MAVGMCEMERMRSQIYRARATKLGVHVGIGDRRLAAKYFLAASHGACVIPIYVRAISLTQKCDFPCFLSQIDETWQTRWASDTVTLCKISPGCVAQGRRNGKSKTAKNAILRKLCEPKFLVCSPIPTKLGARIGLGER